MVYINREDRYCRHCGTLLGRKPYLRRGHHFCNLICFETWVDPDAPIDLDDYRTQVQLNGGAHG